MSSGTIFVVVALVIINELSVFVLIPGFRVTHKDMACAEYVTSYR